MKEHRLLIRLHGTTFSARVSVSGNDSMVFLMVGARPLSRHVAFLLAPPACKSLITGHSRREHVSSDFVYPRFPASGRIHVASTNKLRYKTMLTGGGSFRPSNQVNRHSDISSK